MCDSPSVVKSTITKDIDLIDVEASQELEPIIRIGAGKLKLPMRDGYMPMPTLPVAG